MNILGYTTEDIIKVLQEIVNETEENRNRANKLYDHMEQAMLNNKGDLVVLSQMADKYLEQATRQTELRVRLLGIMQKLKQFNGQQEGKSLLNDVNSLLEILDANKITPFSLNPAGKKTERIEKTVKPAPQKPPADTDEKIEFETDL